MEQYVSVVERFFSRVSVACVYQTVFRDIKMPTALSAETLEVFQRMMRLTPVVCTLQTRLMRFNAVMLYNEMHV
jgi:hypothetical protein